MGRFPHQVVVYPVLTINFGEQNYVTGLGLWSPFVEKVSYISEIPHQHPHWYFKPIKFRHLLIFLTSQKSNFNPKKFKSRHFFSPIHIISLLSLFPFSLSLHAISVSSRSLSLCMLSLSLPGLSVFSQPFRLAPPCASPTLSLTRPHLRLSHCRTTFSNPTPLKYHCLTLIFGDPISISDFTLWYSSNFSLFFVCFYFWVFI